jgi:NPL4 family
MTRDGIIEASTNPALMRVAPSTPTKYIPDVFFKYKNEYKIMVQEAAKPTFPVEYLLITVMWLFNGRVHMGFHKTLVQSLKDQRLLKKIGLVLSVVIGQWRD